MQTLQADEEDTRRRWRPILRSTKLRLALLGIALAALLLYFAPRLGLYRLLSRAVGNDGALVAVIVLLIAVVGAGVVAIVYGFGVEQSDRRPRHRDSRSR